MKAYNVALYQFFGFVFDLVYKFAIQYRKCKVCRIE